VKDSSTANAEGTSDFKDESVSVNQLCDILGLTRPPVHRLIRTQKIKSFMRGGRRRIKNEEVRRYLEQGDHPDSKKE
jgi:excisionase family DNA binding protein